jgi:hypothetical protein
MTKLMAFTHRQLWIYFCEVSSRFRSMYAYNVYDNATLVALATLDNWFRQPKQVETFLWQVWWRKRHFKITDVFRNTLFLNLIDFYYF